MEHILVMPMDPNGVLFPHLERITPALKTVFSGAVISVLPGEQRELLADPFFRVLPMAKAAPVGQHFHALYHHAAESCPPEAVLHLCFPDRLAFQVEGALREDFFASIRGLRREALPLIFQRSAAAWASHPRNYREIEDAITTLGSWICGRRLDFAWCHLAVEAGQLGSILPAVRRSDMSMMAEMIVQLRQVIQTQDVDWLAWEDPFVLERPAEELKREREQSLEETRKRLSYAMPMMEVLYEAATPRTDGGAPARANRPAGPQVVHQGDIYWVSLPALDGSEGGIPHPHVVVQDDIINHSRVRTVVVCALTTNQLRAKAPGNVLLEAGEANLPRQSSVEVSKVSTVDKARLGPYIGSLSEERVAQILSGMRFVQVWTDPRR